MMRVQVVVQELRYLLRDRTAVWCARVFLLMFVAVTAAAAVWWPTQSHQHNLLQELRTLSRVQAEMERAVALTRQVETTRADLTRFEEKLARGVEQADWIESVARIAASRQLRVLSQSVEEGKPLNGYLPLTLTVSVTGNYRGLRDLLLAVPTLPVFCVVHELRVEAAKDRATPLRAQLKLMAFRRQDGNTKVTRL